MPLTPGTQLGSYEIVDLLGAGGMGEVYRARDQRLGRDVAVKTLPDSVTKDPERLARFRREAQVLAALNHQHIASIYGLEEVDRLRFLVLELVDGETLAARIQRGALPIEEALPIAREIAEALESAHERGIVHRDLKPANIALTSRDRVKVLDFGLAKAVDVSGSVDSISALNSPTITSPAMLTQVGVILGTAAYMSPEQTRGRAADKRSDVWAFGCVLFEMLTGKRAFEGEEVSDTLAAVLKSDPPWDALPPSLPPSIRTLLKGCLEKNHRERISDMSVALFVLKQDTSRGLDSVARAPASRGKRAWQLAALMAAGAALGSGAAAIALWPRSSAPMLPVVRFALPTAEGPLLTLSRRVVAVSPDGSYIAFGAGGRLFIRSLVDGTTRPLAGADPGVLPAFSPNGQSIVFWSPAGSDLRRISIAGGVPVRVCDARNPPFALVWDASGILFDRSDTGIVRVSPDGGAPQPIVRLTNKDGLVQKLQLLPDGDSVVFSLARTDALGAGDVVVQSIKTGERKILVEGGLDPHYIPTGHLLYVVGGSLMMRPFNLRRKEFTGGAVPVIDGIFRSGGANYAVSDTGVLAYLPGPLQSEQNNVIVYDRKGSVKVLPLPRGTYQNPRVSPDGKRLALEINDGKHWAIALYELSGGNSIQRLTYDGNSRVPVWSADSKRVAFQSDREGDHAIFWQPIDGGRADRLTHPEAGTIHTPESWAPSSDLLLFSETKEPQTTLWTFSTSSRKASRFDDVISIGMPTDAAFSPDGRWIAYQIGTDGSAEGGTYVQPFPPTGNKHQVSRGGRPMWSPAGSELFVVPAPGQFQAVTIRTQPSFGFGNPVDVPRRFPLAFPGNPRPYDMMPDGSFVTVGAATGGDQAPPQIQVVLNWFEELKLKQPAAK